MALTSPPDLWKLFERAFKYADYMFKFFGWILLASTIEYIGKVSGHRDLEIVAVFVFLGSAFVAGLFVGWLVLQTIDFIQDRRIYFATAIPIYISFNMGILYVEYRLLIAAGEFAMRKMN